MRNSNSFVLDEEGNEEKCFSVSSELISRGMNISGLEFQNLTTKFNVLEANVCSGKYNETK